MKNVSIGSIDPGARKSFIKDSILLISATKVRSFGHLLLPYVGFQYGTVLEYGYGTAVDTLAVAEDDTTIRFMDKISANRTALDHTF